MLMLPYDHYDNNIIKKVKEYEEICNRCYGTGIKYVGKIPCICKLCRGRGKIDWVDKIKIKKDNRNEKDKNITNRGRCSIFGSIKRYFRGL